MQVADSSDTSVLLIMVVLGALLVGWGFYWRFRAPKRWFHKHYGIDLPRAYNVRWSRGSAIRFELVPPSWAYSRVDGTRDGRYASNNLVWRPSTRGGFGSSAKVKTKSTGLNIMLGVVLSPFIFAFLLGALSAMTK